MLLFTRLNLGTFFLKFLANKDKAGNRFANRSSPKNNQHLFVSHPSLYEIADRPRLKCGHTHSENPAVVGHSTPIFLSKSTQKGYPLHSLMRLFVKNEFENEE